MSAEGFVEDEVAGFVESKPKRSAGEELHDVSCLRVNGPRRRTAEHGHCRNPSGRGTHVAAFPIEAQHCCEEGLNVLETIAIILIVLWLLGMVSGYTLGNFIWVLLVVAVVLFLVRLVSGRRVV
jgi:hypothetical protein